MYIFIRCFANEYKPLHIIYNKRFLSRTTETRRSNPQSQATENFRKSMHSMTIVISCVSLSLSFSLYCVPLQILIYKLFGSQSSTIMYTSLQLRIPPRSRARESPNIFYYCTITSYVILILIYILLSSLLLCIHVLSISI